MLFLPFLANYLIFMWVHVKSLQSCLTLCDPMDCSLPGSSVFLGFSRQEYWGGLWFPSPGDLPDPGINARSPESPALVQFSSVIQLCPTLCNPMDCSMPGLLVHHQLPKLTQTHVHWAGDAIQPSHPLSSLFPPTFNLSQHHSLFKWVSSSNQVAKVLEFQLQHQSFQWTLRTDLL